ncbi:thioredoxin family protein [Microbacteriaceae bacterium 4G12]
MKKMLIFGSILVLVLIALAFITKFGEKKDYYKNQISLEQLQKDMQAKQDATIYFYQTNCSHCANVSPIVVPMAEKMKIDMKVIDLEKYPAGWDEFNIKGTPTIIRYKGGKEVSRIEGEQPKDEYTKWFKKNK